MSKEHKAYSAPRGIRDVLPEELPLWSLLERTAAREARLRGFREIRPALLEETDLFIRSVGEVTDIVEKEMFTLERGKNSFSLRPEATAGIVRAYLQAGYAKTRPIQRLFHIGPMFRYERPQKGRERMFTQFDVEALGSSDPRLDAELIHMASAFFTALGFEGLEVRLSSMGDGEDRDRFRDALREFLEPRLSELCELCQARFHRNVLRILDCKKEGCRNARVGAPAPVEFLSSENEAHLVAVRASLDALGVRWSLDPELVRGLDYYTRTVFEIHCHELGARSAICGGGRYDHLVRDLGGPDLPAVGFAIGFTPTLIAMKELGLVPELAPEVPACFVVAAGEDLGREVLGLAESLRGAGISALYDLEEKSVKAQMKAAAKGGQRYALILGPEELERGTVQVKDLAQNEQRELERGRLAEILRQELGLAAPVRAGG